MTDPSPLKQTPKRKRGEELSFSPLLFSFDMSSAGPSDDGRSSPPSSVVHRFRGLMLGSGGGATAEDIDMETDNLMRKRQKPDDVMQDVMQPQAQPEPEFKPESEPSALSDIGSDNQEIPLLDMVVYREPILPSTAYPSQSREARREPAPPLRTKKGQAQDGQSDADDEAEITDPVRAALTWHEDEITIYDPNDEDDDGTGINGIGFKPSPALAHARVLKRRQQMAEYRKREESEARAKRSQRRRGEILAARRDNKSPPRRVRFMDAERRNIAVTTG
ncbi:hypothetical protein PT974_03996 [Cladobotryum mycophilum]|uniref:BZIP domain-containing protein n=1 Tax=Cladobotryum mycophilum TaxID=491253 RepID=A0ABR0STY3_9HYPO